MAQIDITNGGIRQKIVEEINSQENLERKKLSLGEYEVFMDRIKKWVVEYLRDFYSNETILELPIVSTMNISKRVVEAEAAIYTSPPTRTFTKLSDTQQKDMLALYKKMGVDSAMQKANKYFVLQDNQTHLYIIPSNGDLKLKVLLAHQMDAVNNVEDAETADAYIISGFDHQLSNIQLAKSEDGVNELIADPDDYQAALHSKAWWSDLYNFLTDEKGNITTPLDQLSNPLKLKPIVDISSSKDGEYWCRSGAALTDFTVQFNASLTDSSHIVRMQGFGQAFLKGPESLIAQNIQVGPNFILKLPVDPNTADSTEFGFANANPDLDGTIKHLEFMLSIFLSSRNNNPQLINGAGTTEKYSSGLDRMLAMLDAYEPAKEDTAVFEKAEKQLFKIIKAYLNTYGGSPLLPGYSKGIPEDADVEIKYSEPTMVMSETDKLGIIQLKRDLGIMSRSEAIAFDRGITIEEAKKAMDEIDAEDGLKNVGTGDQTQQDQGQPNN